MFRSLVTPNLEARAGTGLCLLFVQLMFGAPSFDRVPGDIPSATRSWRFAKRRHGPGEPLPDVPVPVYFSHWGWYGPSGDMPYQWADWGHVIGWAPSAFGGRGGFLSSPTGGFGQQWFSSIEAVERAFNATYVGWAEDLNGRRIAEPINALSPKEGTVMSKPFSGKSERTNPQVLGSTQKPVTFLDHQGDDRWGNRTLMRGPGVVNSSFVTVKVKGKPGTRAEFELVSETAAGKNRVKLGEGRANLDSLGLDTVVIGWAGALTEGRLVRLLGMVQKGREVEVQAFYWNGTTG